MFHPFCRAVRFRLLRLRLDRPPSGFEVSGPANARSHHGAELASPPSKIPLSLRGSDWLGRCCFWRQIGP